VSETIIGKSGEKSIEGMGRQTLLLAKRDQGALNYRRVEDYDLVWNGLVGGTILGEKKPKNRRAQAARAK